MPDNLLDDDSPAAITLAPDWVGEVLSESTEAKDRGKKRRICRREAVRHDWIVATEAVAPPRPIGDWIARSRCRPRSSTSRP